MTLYAASNLDYVAVSAEGHGGCGNPHRRPVVKGAPVHPWALDCPPCENHLRHDPLWSATISEIPETYDERLARQDFEKRGAKDKDAVMTLALARIAGIPPEQLPDTLTRMVSGAKAHVPQQVNCPAGHPNHVSQRFCGECGQSLSAPSEAATAPVTYAAADEGMTPSQIREKQDELNAAADESAGKVIVLPAESKGRDGDSAGPSVTVEPPAPVLPSNTKMRGMKRPELAALARTAGLDDSGTRAELLERLIAANNGG